MKSLSLLALSLLFAISVSAFDVAPGTYSGDYNSSDGSTSGKLKVTLSRDSTKNWAAVASFTYSGQDVPTNMISVNVDGDKVEMVYEYEIDDMHLKSRMTGVLAGKSLAGKYESSAADGSVVSDGTWKVTLQ